MRPPELRHSSSGQHGTGRALTFIEQGTVWLPDPEPGRVWFGLFAYTARECADCEPRLALSHVAPGGLVPY